MPEVLGTAPHARFPPLSEPSRDRPPSELLLLGRRTAERYGDLHVLPVALHDGLGRLARLRLVQDEHQVLDVLDVVLAELDEDIALFQAGLVRRAVGPDSCEDD